jgi:hypothetical protein
VAKLGARIVSLDLPLVFGDALVFEFDSGFAHAAVMTVFRQRSQRGCCLSCQGRRSNRSRHDRTHPRERVAWLIDAANMMPPRDPNDDDYEGEDENGDDESEDDEPAVIREPDE